MASKHRQTAGPVGVPYRHRLLTVPNLVSAVRLALVVPAVPAVLAVRERPVRAFGLVAVFALSDWVDGVLARALGQRSRLGEVLDPIADRLGTVTIAVAASAVGLFPWRVLVVVAAVDAAVGTATLVRGSLGTLRVTAVGKAKTALLMAGTVLVVAGPAWSSPRTGGAGRVLVRAAAALHVVAGAQYLHQALRRQAPDGDTVR